MIRGLYVDEVEIVGATGNKLTVEPDGSINVNADLEVSDLEIGAVEIKNGADDTRAIVTIANALKVDNSGVIQPVSGPLTNAELRADPVEVTGDFSSDGLTDAELRASPVPVSISSDIEIGAVEIKNGADDTRAIVTASNALKVDGSAVTQPISAVSLPLPSDAATSANQATEIISLASIDTKTPALVGGRQPVDGSGVTQPISAVSLPLPSNASTESTLGTVSTRIGDVVETAPATDTASSGLNGRLQRIAQRITSLIALIPASLGQKTSANSLAVVVASDQSAIPISGSVTATNASIGTNGSAIPLSSTQIGGSDGTNLQVPRVFDADTGAGTQYVLGTVLRKTASGGSVEAGTSTDPLRVDPTGTTTQPISFLDKNLDAFGRLRVGNPFSLFTGQFLYDKQPLSWVERLVTGGTATKNTNSPHVDLAVTTSSGSRTTFQSGFYFRYQNGKSLRITMTSVLGTAKANCSQRVGYFDDSNGVFFEMAGTTFNVVRRTNTSGSVVNNSVAQASWNLDKLDGTGTSGVTLDTTKINIYIIDFQWLSAGRIRFGVDVAGTVIYCHQILNANVLSLPWMATPNLPVRYDIENTGVTSGATTMFAICASVDVEGGVEQKYNKFSQITTANKTNSTLLPIISMRLKTTRIRENVYLESFNTVVDSADSVYVKVLLNPSLTGAAFTSANANSHVDYDVTATALTGGTILFSGFLENTSQRSLPGDINFAYPLLADVAGTASDVLTLAMQTLDGSNGSFQGSLSWRELV